MESSLVLQFVVDTRKHFSKHERKEWNGVKRTSKLTVPNCELAVHLDAETDSNDARGQDCPSGPSDSTSRLCFSSHPYGPCGPPGANTERAEDCLGAKRALAAIA